MLHLLALFHAVGLGGKRGEDAVQIAHEGMSTVYAVCSQYLSSGGNLKPADRRDLHLLSLIDPWCPADYHKSKQTTEH